MRAADVAAALAVKMNLPLKLHHSVPDAVVSVEMPVITQVESQAREALEREAERLRAQGAVVEAGLHFGRPVDDILHGANPEHARMVVLGSAGRGMAGRWLIGSVAERVAEHAPVPTLVVRQAGPLLEWLEKGATLKMLCGVDFSVSADAALLAAKSLAKLGPAHLDAAYVEWPHDWPWPTPEGFVDTGGEEWRETQASHQRDLWERVSGLMEGVPTNVHVRGTGGRLDYEFVRLADELQSGLLVVGTHQRTGLQRLRGPSFSRGTLAHAAGNVLCVPLASYKPEYRTQPVKSVLVATDFSATGNAALRWAYNLLAQDGVVHLLHVISPPTSPNPLIGGMPTRMNEAEVAEQKRLDEERLKALVPKEMAARSVRVDVRVVASRDVAGAICEAAGRLGVDVICIGSRGHSAVVSAVVGSVAQGVIAHARMPVLTVPVGVN